MWMLKMFSWFRNKNEDKKDESVDQVHDRSWELKREDSLITRSKILAEIAMADFANDRHGLTDRAAFRIAEALEKYAMLDNMPDPAKAPPPPPDRYIDGTPIPSKYDKSKP